MTSIASDRRSRKRQATRQHISDVATGLFFERGFDAVTIDEIASAADVSRMTVFNHFPRKEDMFFDRDAEGRDRILEALRTRNAATAPIDALCRLAHDLVVERPPYLRFFTGSQAFIATIEASEALKARARAIRDEITGLVAEALARSIGHDSPDAEAELAAALLLATWSVALAKAHETYRRTGRGDAAEACFLALIDRGSAGVKAAMANTPYL